MHPGSWCPAAWRLARVCARPEQALAIPAGQVNNITKRHGGKGTGPGQYGLDPADRWGRSFPECRHRLDTQRTHALN